MGFSRDLSDLPINCPVSSHTLDLTQVVPIVRAKLVSQFGTVLLTPAGLKQAEACNAHNESYADRCTYQPDHVPMTALDRLWTINWSW